MLTIRAWRDGEDHGLRARLMLATDAASEVVMTELAASAEEVCAIVRTWLDEFA